MASASPFLGHTYGNPTCISSTPSRTHHNSGSGAPTPFDQSTQDETRQHGAATGAELGLQGVPGAGEPPGHERQDAGRVRHRPGAWQRELRRLPGLHQGGRAAASGGAGRKSLPPRPDHGTAHDVKLERHDYNPQAAPAASTVKAEGTTSPVSTAETTELNIRRAGHYRASAVLIPSRTIIPMDAIHSAAGFSTEDDAALLPRAAVTPPEDLQKQLFPQVEEWFPHLNSRNAETQDMTAVGPCKLLKELCVALLQDAAQLIDRFPNSAIWRHSVFSSDAFNEFKHQVHSEAHTSAEADALALQRALPIPSTTIARGFEGLSARNKGVGQALQSISAAITTAAAGGRIRASVAERHEETATSDVSAAITTAAGDLGCISHAGGLDIVESSSSNILTAGVTLSNPRRIPRVYVLAKGLSSITDVWKEYDEGLEGRPPVREMERVHGRHWRADDAQARFSRKRKQVHDAMKRVAAAKNILASVAAEKLEVERLRRRQTVPTFSRSIASVASELFLYALHRRKCISRINR